MSRRIAETTCARLEEIVRRLEAEDARAGRRARAVRGGRRAAARGARAARAPPSCGCRRCSRRRTATSGVTTSMAEAPLGDRGRSPRRGARPDRRAARPVGRAPRAGDRRPARRRAGATRLARPASGCAPRWCSPPTARPAARRPPSPARGGGRDGARLLARARRPALHGRRRPPPRAPHHAPRVRRAHGDPGRASCWCRSRRGCSPRRPSALGLSPAAARAAWRASCFEAGGIGGMVGGQWLDLEAEGGRLTLDAARSRSIGARPAR